MIPKETPSYNPTHISRKWYQIDATGLRLGRLATQVAVLLQGKHRSTYTPHQDLGDHVIVYNCDAVACTTKDKIYYRHSGRMGGLKERTLDEQMVVSSERVVMLAVKRMLKRSPLGRQMLTKLRCHAGQHTQEAQRPVSIDLSHGKCLAKEIYCD
ncbi:MAG: 50S ribosomal protein L13 [Pseudomonadota bacterium]|nr:50S ribosomal protein L13 [Pseudomonadota bacterium]